MIEFPVPPSIAAQLDASAVQAKAFVAGISSMRYALDALNRGPS